MTTTNFTDEETPIVASWLNDVNKVAYSTSLVTTKILRGDGAGGIADIFVGDGLQYASFTVSIKGLTGFANILYENPATQGVSPVVIGTGLSFAGGTLACTVTGTVTNVSGTAPVVSSGGATPVISIPAATTAVNGYLTATDWNTFNGKQAAGSYVTSVAGTSPIASSGGTTPTVSIAQANTITAGYLTAADWNTFNGKAPATSGTAILYGNGTGGFSSVTIGTSLQFSGGILSFTGSAANIDIRDEGTSLTTTPTSIDFVGAGITASAVGNAVTVTVTGGGGSGGTVTTVSGVDTNGFAWSIANPTTTPALTLSTSITGIIKGDGTALSAAVSGTDLKTIGGTSILGSGDIALNAGTVTSVSGTAPVSSSGGTTPTISMAAASAGANGYLTSADWNTFNNKQVAGSYAPATSGTSILIGNGTGGFANLYVGDGLQYASSTLSIKGMTGSANILYETGAGGFAAVIVGTGLSFVGGTLSNTVPGGVTSVTGTAPVVSSGGVTPAISIPAATTSANGYLTSTDWNTFNGKQAALGFTPYNATNPAGYTSNVGTVTSVAALTLGTTGTDLSSTVATGTTTPVITLQVPTASATSRGVLSATDWSAFNAKAPATSGTSILIGNGAGGFNSLYVGDGLQYASSTLSVKGMTGAANILYETGAGGFAAVTIGSGLTFVGGTLTAIGGGGTVTAVNATSPVLSSGGTTPTISLPSASGTVNGYLTSTDWTTFNSKQPAGSYLTHTGSLTSDSVVVGNGTADIKTVDRVKVYDTDTSTTSFTTLYGKTIYNKAEASWHPACGMATIGKSYSDKFTILPAVGLSARGTTADCWDTYIQDYGSFAQTDNTLYNSHYNVWAAFATIPSSVTPTAQPSGSWNTPPMLGGYPTDPYYTEIGGYAVTLGIGAAGNYAEGVGVTVQDSPIPTGSPVAARLTGSTVAVKKDDAHNTWLSHGYVSGSVGIQGNSAGLTYAPYSAYMAHGGWQIGLDLSGGAYNLGDIKFQCGTISSSPTQLYINIGGVTCGSWSSSGLGVGYIQTTDFTWNGYNIPKPTGSSSTFLRNDGTWAVPSGTPGGTVTHTSGALTANYAVVGAAAADLKVTTAVALYSTDTVHPATFNIYGKTLYNPTAAAWNPVCSTPTDIKSYGDKVSYFPAIGLSSRGTAADCWSTFVQDYSSVALTSSALYNGHYNTWGAAAGIPAGLAHSAPPGGEWNDPIMTGGAPVDPYYTEIGGYAVTLGIGTINNYAEGFAALVKDSPLWGGAAVAARLTGCIMAVQKDDPHNTWNSYGYMSYSNGAQQTTYAPRAAYAVAGGWQAGLDLSRGAYNLGDIKFQCGTISSTSTQLFFNIGGTTVGSWSSYGVGITGSVTATNFYGNLQGNASTVSGDNYSYTGTVTGLTATTTGTVYLARVGNVVTVDLPGLYGTSNASTMTLTGSTPAAMRPARDKQVLVGIIDNSIINLGIAVIKITGTIEFYQNVAGNVFTASGVKGFSNTSFSYTVN